MAKYQSAPVDPYVDRTHQVLRNRFGITDAAELARVEVALSSARAMELANKPIKGNFDLAHLQQIHKHLFGDLYEWAGQIRTVDITKGQTRFAHYAYIESYAPQVTTALAREGYLHGLAAEQFSERAAHYLGELNVLHPFREGNGRALREFVNQLATRAGYHIQWQGVDREANIRASIQAYQGDSSGLAALISTNLVDYDRQRAIDLAKGYAGEDVRAIAARPNQVYTGRILGVTDRYVVQEQGPESKHVVLHERRTLSASVPIEQGRILQVSYQNGRVGLVTETVPSDLNKQRQIDRGFER